VPTDYTGDQTLTQAPAQPPQSEGSILVRIPADGDPENASTWEQALKVLGDYIDFLLKPRALATVWWQAIMAWRTSLGHRRFAVDHLGFPAGRWFGHEVVWRSNPSVATSMYSGAADLVFVLMPDWRYLATQTAGATAQAGMLNGAYGPLMGIQPGEGLGDHTTISAGMFGAFRTDNHVALEFAAFGPNSVQRILTVGLGMPATMMESLNDWIGFRVLSGTWYSVTKSGGVETATSTGVTAALSGRPDRLRVEWHGEDVSDDGTRAVRFFVNGVAVTTHTTNLPLNSSIGIGISDYRFAAGSTVDRSFIGPMRLRVSDHNADSVL
jgi:hypothetical protein